MMTKIKTKTKDEDKTPDLDRMQSPEWVPCCVEALASFYRSHTSVRHLGKEDMRSEDEYYSPYKKESEKKGSK